MPSSRNPDIIALNVIALSSITAIGQAVAVMIFFLPWLGWHYILLAHRCDALLREVTPSAYEKLTQSINPLCHVEVPA